MFPKTENNDQAIGTNKQVALSPRKVFFHKGAPNHRAESLVLGVNLFLNPMLPPPRTRAEVWKEILAKTFCESFGLQGRRMQNLLASQIDIVYKESGMYEKERRNTPNPLHLLNKFESRYLSTRHAPALEEAITFLSLFTLLKNPKLKRAFCSTTPNDGWLVLRSREKALHVFGQEHLEEYNLWAFLILINKFFETRKGQRLATPLHVHIAKELFPKGPPGSSGFIQERQHLANMFVKID